MPAESRSRAGHRAALKARWPKAIVRGRPGNAWSGEGWPDLEFLWSGVYVALELKVGRNPATPVQLARIDKLRKAGGYAWVVYTPAQSVAAVQQALTRRRMPEDYNFLFDDDAAPPETATEAAERNEEIRAFLEPPPAQEDPAGVDYAAVQDAVALDQQPSPDGITTAETVANIEAGFARLLIVFEEMRSISLKMIETLTAMQSTAADSTPEEPAVPPPPRSRRRK